MRASVCLGNNHVIYDKPESYPQVKTFRYRWRLRGGKVNINIMILDIDPSHRAVLRLALSASPMFASDKTRISCEHDYTNDFPGFLDCHAMWGYPWAFNAIHHLKTYDTLSYFYQSHPTTSLTKNLCPSPPAGSNLKHFSKAQLLRWAPPWVCTPWCSQQLIFEAMRWSSCP